MVLQIEKTEKMKHFLQGFASTFDITGRMFVRQENSDLSGFEKDYMAIRGDWINIGNDMRKTINKVMYGK